MNKLSKTARQNAVAFLRREARPLEQKLYNFHFENGPAAEVLAELARFQNPDGGFGHGLEPDLRLPGSSVIATTIAFQRLRELDTPKDHPLIVGGCRYLREQYNEAASSWAIMPPNVDEAPHAPWWTYGGDLSRSQANPRAEIAGYLHEYADHFPEPMRRKVGQVVVEHLLDHPDDMPMHDFLCYVRFYETPALPAAIKTTIVEKMKRVADRIVARDPESWKEYGLPPLSVVTSPGSDFAPLFRAALDANLDFEIAQQTEAGYWAPNWTWGDLWPEAWAQAERDWRGVLTLNALKTLHTFGRLE